MYSNKYNDLSPCDAKPIKMCLVKITCKSKMTREAAVFSKFVLCMCTLYLLLSIKMVFSYRLLIILLYFYSTKQQASASTHKINDIIDNKMIQAEVT